MLRHPTRSPGASSERVNECLTCRNTHQNCLGDAHLSLPSPSPPSSASIVASLHSLQLENEERGERKKNTCLKLIRILYLLPHLNSLNDAPKKNHNISFFFPQEFHHDAITLERVKNGRTPAADWLVGFPRAALWLVERRSAVEVVVCHRDIAVTYFTWWFFFRNLEKITSNSPLTRPSGYCGDSTR